MPRTSLHPMALQAAVHPGTTRIRHVPHDTTLPEHVHALRTEDVTQKAATGSGCPAPLAGPGRTLPGAGGSKRSTAPGPGLT